ncbi:uncharacterized protein LOC124890090 [Capsicum annuum]|uniref:uncharacterized protein LOC124890090 n=1 Tax=Capsicum annuum TaxID=4072 RepID=UPI001FB0C877|nr:uncharacterized protein LOC124890090 [Capsicum annuum]
MVKGQIVLEHKILKKGIEVDKAKIEMIEKLPPPICVKGIRIFMSHAGFNKRLIKESSIITNPLSILLDKDMKFVFDDACLKDYECLQESLISTSIIVPPDWTLPLEFKEGRGSESGPDGGEEREESVSKSMENIESRSESVRKGSAFSYEEVKGSDKEDPSDKPPSEIPPSP